MEDKPDTWTSVGSFREDARIQGCFKGSVQGIPKVLLEIRFQSLEIQVLRAAGLTTCKTPSAKAS